MKKMMVVLAMVLVMVTLVFAIDQPQWLNRVYAGGLYTRSIIQLENYNTSADPMVGVVMNFNLPNSSGKIHSKFFTHFDESVGSHLWWEKDFFSGTNLKIGYVPLVPSFMFRPTPVSPEGHFENPNFWVFPTVGPAIVGTYSGKTGRIVAGVYAANKKDSLSVSAGAEKDLNIGPLKSIGFAGYVGNSKSQLGRTMGATINLKCGSTDINVFAKQDTTGKNTYSGMVCYNLASGGVYITGIMEKLKGITKQIPIVEIGWFRIFQKAAYKDVGCLVGVGYDYSNVAPKTGQIYIQLFYDKKN